MVSVCIATHNGEEYIESQISSILPQLRENDEIIVSDDGSKDRTLDIVNAFKDKRIKVHILKSEPVLKKHSNFYNATKNFENAIKNANGDFIFLCDQDDIWYNNKIEICLNYLQQYDYVKHDYSTIDKNGRVISITKYNKSDYKHWNALSCLRYLPFRGCCMAFRKSVIEKVQPFPSNCFQHDSWIGMMAVLKRFKFKYIDRPLIYHRVHGNNVSELSIPNSFFYRLKYRLILIGQLVRRLI